MSSTDLNHSRKRNVLQAWPFWRVEESSDGSVRRIQDSIGAHWCWCLHNIRWCRQVLAREVPYTQAGNAWIQLAEAHTASGVCLSTAELHAHNVHDHRWAWQQRWVETGCGPADTSVDLLVNCYSSQLFRWRMSWLAVSLCKLVMTD